jgi:hypothetical protein
VPELRPPVDVVVCSDCIYMATSVEPLLQTMSLLSDERTEIWVGSQRPSLAWHVFSGLQAQVAHQHRNPAVERLFREKARAMAFRITMVRIQLVQTRTSLTFPR